MSQAEHVTERAADESLSWVEQNQRWLGRELRSLKQRIDAACSEPELAYAAEAASGDVSRGDGSGLFVSALERCSALFGLSIFERELLLLAAGVELDSGLRDAVMRANAALCDVQHVPQPTFSLALRVLAQPHWDAISPRGRLRRLRLVELEARRSTPLQPLHIDERVLHFLTGSGGCDERLDGIVRIEAPHAARTTATSQLIAQALGGRHPAPRTVLLTPAGCAQETLRTAARAGLAQAGMLGIWLLARDLPSEPGQLADITLLIGREAALSGAVPVIELGEPHSEHEHRGLSLLARLLGSAVALGAPARQSLDQLSGRDLIRVDVSKTRMQALDPFTSSRLSQAKAAAFDSAFGPALRQFHLSASALDAVVAELSASDADPTAMKGQVWRACRQLTRGGLDGLAQRVESSVTLTDVELPDAQAQLVAEIAVHLRHRQTVYEDWRLGGKSDRGRGMCALFAGESGTGKTLAAEAIANEVELDLYRIDLALIVSKYIGETEKNLKQVFDAAEASGAVLLFDEADALFGKRSEVKDSHDRYANVEVAYLLQRVEAYRGLVILTTNFRSAIDRAFLRRIQVIVQFPFPDGAARERIWRRELPQSAPLHEVDFEALARLRISGGHIRNVAINAAFLAAAAGEPISMHHLNSAAQREAAKLERPLTDLAELAWS